MQHAMPHRSAPGMNEQYCRHQEGCEVFSALSNAKWSSNAMHIWLESLLPVL